MTKLFFNEITKRQLDQFSLHLPGALLITGEIGVGLTAAAHAVAASSKAVVQTIYPEKDEKVDIEKGTITVNSIRRLYAITKTVEPNGRVIVIDYAERMAKAAQNAFLKLLEEPSEGTHFILLTHQPGLLLPTIRSRAQRLDMRPISKDDSIELLDRLKIRDDRQQSQLLFIAAGFPAELTRLVEDQKYFENRSGIIKDAREYIVGSAYTRLLLAKKYKDDRTNALLLLSDAMRLLQKTIANGGDEQSIAMISQLEAIYGYILGNGNIRLQLASI